MTRSENRPACEAGDAGTLGEGYSKFDFNGTMVRILLLVYDYAFINM
jgi:histone-lysine N-methyltransferase EZH2